MQNRKRSPLHAFMHRVCCRPIAVALQAACAASAAAATFVGPSPYLQFSDSPFNPTAQFSYFHLEDYEDGALNTPGVTSTAGQFAVSSPGTDSVDADDGLVDGLGQNGRSFEFFTNSLTYTFNATVLGAYPTHVGLVWTDVGFAGVDQVTLEAFDVVGASLGASSPAIVGDGTIAGLTAEDRFFGVIHLAGISKITLHVGVLDTEVDHLQYGVQVPEPATGGIMLAGAGLLWLRRVR